MKVRTQLGPGGYERCETYGEGERVPPSLEGTGDLDVSALLAGISA